MAPIKALNKVKLKFEYDKYCKISKTFSKDGKIINELGLINAISNEVSKDSKVKYVQEHFTEAKKFEYDKIFGGYSTVPQFFNRCIPDRWINNLQKNSNNNIICGKSVSEYETAGYGIKDCGGYWFVWLIGKEIRKRAQIAADGIKKGEQADNDFSPQWDFISTAKMNNVTKALEAKATMAKVASEAAAKATKINVTTKEKQQDEQNSHALTSTFRNKSETSPITRARRNSIEIAEGISDTKSKFSLKKSLSKLSFSKTKKSKDDTLKPNQRGLKNLREKYKLKKASKEKILLNKDIQIVERCLNYDWSKEYKNNLKSSNNALDYLKSDFTNDDITNLFKLAKDCIGNRLKHIRESAQKNDDEFCNQKNESDKKFNEFKEEYKEKWLNIFKYCKDNQDNYNNVDSSIRDCLDYVGPPTKNKSAIFKIEGQYVYNNFFENREYLTSALGSGEEQRMLSALDDAKTPFTDASKNIERLYSGNSNLDLVVAGLTSWEESVKEIMKRTQKLFECRNKFKNDASKYINEAYNKVKEEEEQTIKNENIDENLNKIEKSFSKESQNELDELMEKSKKKQLSSEEQNELKKLLQDKPDNEKELDEILEEFMM